MADDIGQTVSGYIPVVVGLGMTKIMLDQTRALSGTRRPRRRVVRRRVVRRKRR